MTLEDAIALAGRKGLRVYMVGQLDDGMWRACVIDSRRNSASADKAVAVEAVLGAVESFFAVPAVSADRNDGGIFA